MSFARVTSDIAVGFAKAKMEPFGQHPMATLIRHNWPRELGVLMGSTGRPIDFNKYSLVASPGLGQWSDAPWLAILDRALTDSATYGFYPVFLFEPAFETVCLVLGQGAERLTRAVGRKSALLELKTRAALLRKFSLGWEQAGFSEGPFATIRRASAASPDAAERDPWSASVAYGKRYHIKSMPEDNVIANDVHRMLVFYAKLSKSGALQFAAQDGELEELKDGGELPEGAMDGVKRVVWHKRIEARSRNGKLIAEVKKRMGTECQACNFSFSKRYGSVMSGYIEAHHIKPISTLPEGGAHLQPTANDFMVLCSNCHRAIHRAGCPDLGVFKQSLSK